MTSPAPAPPVTDLRGEPLARAALSWLREHPDGWDQDTWKTCFAGTILAMLGGRLLNFSGTVIVTDDDGREEHRYIEEHVNQALGLERGHTLFDSHTSCDCKVCRYDGDEVPCRSRRITLDDLEAEINRLYA
ncbi:hypothetical protein GCM10010466_39240 [Planomonospora alba]|uniref:Uncharacterized protein n=1 Tax=Planomonospora alba TaxID=161354 RepID=A0ABP6NFC7_9ACTN